MNQATRWQQKYAVVTLIFTISCMVYLAANRAGWLDEYWTVWHSNPSTSLALAYWTRWTHDTPHPPTFYALAWMLGGLTGKTLAVRRIVDNGIALLMIIPTAFAVRRDERWSLQAVLFAIVLASSPYFITYFAEHRSYFLALTATACLVATVRAVHLVSNNPGARVPRGIAVWLVIISIVAINLHYTIALTGLVLLFCEFLWQWHRGSRSTAFLIIASASTAFIPLAFNLAIGLQGRPVPVVVYVPVAKGIATIVFMLSVGAATNIALLLRAFGPLRALALRSGGMVSPAQGSFLLVLTATFVLLLTAFVSLELIKHNLVPRLLLGLLPLVLAMICDLAALATISRTWFALICLNAAIVVAVSTIGDLRNLRWEYHASAIRTVVQTCPETRVIAIDPLDLAAPGAVPDITGQHDAIRLSYRMIAKKWGFAVTFKPGDGPPRPPSAGCPTLIWLEHNFFRPDVSTAELVMLAHLPRSDRGKITRDHAGSHDLVTIMP